MMDGVVMLVRTIFKYCHCNHHHHYYYYYYNNNNYYYYYYYYYYSFGWFWPAHKIVLDYLLSKKTR